MALEIPQTTFPTEHDRALPGMVDRTPSGQLDIVSRVLDVDMRPGVMTIKRTASVDPERVRLPTAAGDIVSALLAGVLRMDQSQSPTYAYKAQVGRQSVVRRGLIWMHVAVANVSSAAASSKTLFLVHSGVNAGAVSGAAGAGPDATAVPAGLFEIEEGGAVGGLALINWKLP